MTKLEELEREAYENGLEVIDYHFESTRLKGLYCDNTVALNKTLSRAEKTCVLAEELGHHYTAVGDIIRQDSVKNRKQEMRGRILSYNRLVGLMGIVKSYQANHRTLYDMAEYLEVSERFLLEALEYYKRKYGLFAVVDNYIIYFEPVLGVFELV